MDLKHTAIPPEFLKILPAGIKFLHKKGKEFLVVEKVHCSKGHSLIVDSVRIHGEPAIELDVLIEDQEGSFFIDAFWGSHAKLYNFMPRLKQSSPLVQAFCPVCKASLVVNRECPMEGCDTDKHIVLYLPGEGNRIFVCARLGCPGHYLSVRNLPQGISESVSNINYFGTQVDEDLFQGI